MPSRGKRSPAEDPLTPYRRKRDFKRTPEPDGTPSASRGATERRFTVQRHRASRLHYDFRLEIDGVLVSWAVPKGPTLDPRVRRAAFHVEDHPLDYIDFEGIIPAREYGGGDVIVWDTGTWTPHDAPDPGSAVRDGELHFDLHGTKLLGRFVLVRTRVDSGGKEEWLLLHKHDEYAVDGWVTEDHPQSVVSGRTSDEVKANPERTWHSNRSDGSAVTESLAQLDRLPASGVWEVFGRELRVTNLDKVLFPPRRGSRAAHQEAAVTKRDLLRYTAHIAPTVLPYLTGRPMNLHRFPAGAETAGFWQKALPDHAPAWVPRWDRPHVKAGEAKTYLVVDEPAALLWAANFGGLEWHAWTAPASAPERPSYALIDLDPGSSTRWEDLLVLARLHRDAFDHLGVTACPKVTGRRGIQIWVPIAAGPGFDDTRAWVEQLSKTVGAVVPDLISWKWNTGDRGGLARLDYTQNESHKTLVAPYSPRAVAGATVSAPIDWAELDDPDLRPDGFTIRTMPQRLTAKGDLFRGVLDHPQRLPSLT